MKSIVVVVVYMGINTCGTIVLFKDADMKWISKRLPALMFTWQTQTNGRYYIMCSFEIMFRTNITMTIR